MGLVRDGKGIWRDGKVNGGMRREGGEKQASAGERKGRGWETRRISLSFQIFWLRRRSYGNLIVSLMFKVQLADCFH